MLPLIVTDFCFCFVLSHTHTVMAIYDNFPALLLKEYLGYHSALFQQAPQYNHQCLVNYLDSFLTWQNTKTVEGFKPTVVRSKWFEVNNHNR
jgi:hypothetical protein